LQVHIAREETKFGFNERELLETTENIKKLSLANICVTGLMGMASFTDDLGKVKTEFKFLKSIFDKLASHNPQLVTLSIGMSSDYQVAIEEGSTMVRIGSLIFGARE
jgi:hypothetical protein